MELIVDNNILFSLMKPDSTNSKLFSLMKFKFCAPEFVKYEFKKYEKECLKKSGLSKSKFKKRKKEILNKIQFFKFVSYKDLIKKAKNIIRDEDDSPYIELGLKIKSPIWSNDSELKNQGKVRILSTKDLVEIFL